MCSIEGKIPPHNLFASMVLGEISKICGFSPSFCEKTPSSIQISWSPFSREGGGGGGGWGGIETEIRSHNLISLEVPGINPKICA